MIEIATIRRMAAAGHSLAAIDAALGRGTSFAYRWAVRLNIPISRKPRYRAVATNAPM